MNIETLVVMEKLLMLSLPTTKNHVSTPLYPSLTA